MAMWGGTKTRFKAKALEYPRQVETTGEPLVITDRGRPAVEVRRLRTARSGIQEHVRKGKGSHRMIFDPVTGRHCPLPHHGNDKRRIQPGYPKELIRLFELPSDIFD